MNLSTDDLQRALADLAARADLHPTTDRVPVVHRRARRAAAVKTAAAAAVVAGSLAVAAVALGSARLPFLSSHSADPGRVTPVVPTASLTVGLARDDVTAAALAPRAGTTTVVVEVTVRGLVPRAVQDASSPTDPTTGLASLLGPTIDWGDGGTEGAANQPNQPTCRPGAPLVKVDNQFPMTHFYRAAGTYRVTLRTGGCAPVGEVTQTLTLTVAAPAASRG